MMLDHAIAAAERTEAARYLIAQGQVETVDLVTLSALELCVLGGAQHPLFEESVARAWIQLGERRRRTVVEDATADMVKRGLLIDESPQPRHRGRGGSYALKPELGLMLAARCRPSSIVITDTGRPGLRAPRFFALGDQAQPVRGVVMEEPTTLPPAIAGNYPQVKKLGPLGWFYRYFLLSPVKAAEVLAVLTMSPPRSSGAAVAPGWTVSAHYPGSGNPGGERLSVTGDGTKARVEDPGRGNGSLAGAEYDSDRLRAVMLALITGSPR
jgi:hypothetical protein